MDSSEHANKCLTEGLIGQITGIVLLHGRKGKLNDARTFLLYPLNIPSLGCAELLDVYRAAILRMQQQLRRMPSVSMASLNFSLQEFKACSNHPHSKSDWQAKHSQDAQVGGAVLSP